MNNIFAIRDLIKNVSFLNEDSVGNLSSDAIRSTFGFDCIIKYAHSSDVSPYMKTEVIFFWAMTAKERAAFSLLNFHNFLSLKEIRNELLDSPRPIVQWEIEHKIYNWAEENENALQRAFCKIGIYDLSSRFHHILQ
jgi:hypothetical protein